MSDDSSPTGRVAISCAFEENTIRAISQVAHDRGVLTKRAVRDIAPFQRATAAVSRLARRADALQRVVTKQRVQAATRSLPEDVAVASLAEFSRVAGARFRSPLTPYLGHSVWKTWFDHKASRLDFGEAETLISMPGSSLLTFSKNRDRRLVFHEIDAHPRFRNEVLTNFFGAKQARAEMMPNRFVERIEAELELSDRVLVPSSVVANQMTTNGVAPQKLVRVPFGVDPGLFAPTELLPREDGAVRIVCTAQICLRKGITFLLDAVRGLPVELTLVGQVFDQRIVEHLPSNVTLAGVIPAGDLARLYARADLFVLPTIEDNFALVIAEAAAAGLPVVTTHEAGAAELLSARHTVLDAGDTNALRDAIKSAEPLTVERRREIAEESASTTWSTWPQYGEAVLQGIGALEVNGEKLSDDV